MKLIKFNHWVKVKKDIHPGGYVQITEEHKINIQLFFFIWRAVEWTKYIGEWK